MGYPVGMDVLFVARGHLDHLLGRSEPSIQHTENRSE